MALSVSRSGYYQWAGTEQSLRAGADAELLKQIERVYHEHKGRYGSPRITQQLWQDGWCVGRNRVARLMRENQLVTRRNKAFRPRTTLPGQGAAPNLIKELEPSAPNQCEIRRLHELPLDDENVYSAKYQSRKDRSDRLEISKNLLFCRLHHLPFFSIFMTGGKFVSCQENLLLYLGYSILIKAGM